jgi:hypothetical protein
MHAAVYDFEPERLVCGLGSEVIQPGIRSHLDAALISGPVLGCRDKPGSNSLAPVSGGYIPSLEIPHWLMIITAVGVGPQINLDESQNRSVLFLCEQNHPGQTARSSTGE